MLVSFRRNLGKVRIPKYVCGSRHINHFNVINKKKLYVRKNKEVKMTRLF